MSFFMVKKETVSDLEILVLNKASFLTKGDQGNTSNERGWWYDNGVGW